jgi:YVTN family beta-propeller protein
VGPDGSRVYVTSAAATVSVIDTATNTVMATVNDGNGPIGIIGVAVSPDGSRAYVTNVSSPGTISVIDTDPLSAHYNTVLTMVDVGSAPGGITVSPGALIATNRSASGSVGAQITGTVPGLTNTSGCAASDTLVQLPVQGSVDFTSTGAYTYTPSSATYSGPDAFTWHGQAPSSCPAADSPTDPVGNVAAVSLTITPLLAGLADTTLDESSSTQENFKLTGTAPFRLSLASSNPTVLPVSAVTISSACGTTESDRNCTLNLSSGSTPGASDLTVTATDAFGDAATETMAVTVTAPPMGSGSSGGGGGGVSPLELMILTGLLGLEEWTQRRVRGSRS